jgi:hypothetical protein
MLDCFRAQCTLTYLQSYHGQRSAEVSDQEHDDTTDQTYQESHPANRVIVSNSAKQNRHERVLLTSHTESAHPAFPLLYPDPSL